MAYTCALSMQTEAEESAVEEDRPWVDFQVTKRLFKTKISSTPPHTHTQEKKEGEKEEKMKRDILYRMTFITNCVLCDILTTFMKQNHWRGTGMSSDAH